MTPLTVFWSYVKKYWGIVALVLGGILAFVFFSKQKQSFADQYKKIQDIHEEELREIKVAREAERLEHLANEQKLKDTLAVVEQQYKDAKQEFDAKKKAQVEDLAKKYKDNPTELAKQLSAATGFVIVMPD